MNRARKRKRLAQRERAGEYDNGDDETDDRITIIFEGPFREPYDESSGDDADITKGVAHDVQHKCAHVHGTGMGVSVASVAMVMRTLFGIVMQEWSALGGDPVEGFFAL